MAFSPVAFIAPNYRDFKNEWLKAYSPGTTTPKPMALESNGGTQVTKLQLNADGFIVSAGAALVIPYIDGAYDLWLFPTAAEADANDTSNAIRVADNITGVSLGSIESNLINDLSQAYEFPTLDNAINSIISFPIGKVLHLKERTTGNGGGAVWDVVDVGTVTPNGIDIVASLSLPLAFVMRDVENTLTVSTVASLKSTDLIPRQTAKTQGYYDGWAALAKQEGSSDYIISTLQNIRDSLSDPTWLPDEIQDHTLNNSYIAMMFRVSSYSLDQFGVVGGADDTARLQSAFSNVGEITFNSEKVYVSKDRLKLLDGTTVDLNGARVNFECVGNVENFVMGSHTRLHNGIIDSTGNTTQMGHHQHAVVDA